MEPWHTQEPAPGPAEPRGSGAARFGSTVSSAGLSSGGMHVFQFGTRLPRGPSATDELRTLLSISPISRATHLQARCCFTTKGVLDEKAIKHSSCFSRGLPAVPDPADRGVPARQALFQRDIRTTALEQDISRRGKRPAAFERHGQIRCRASKAVSIMTIFNGKSRNAGIGYAVERDQSIAEGNPPHRICLTNDGCMWTGRAVG